MSLGNRIINAATGAGPIAGLLALLAIVGLLFFAAGGMGFRFDPFDWTERRAERAEATVVVARSDSAARSAEVQGARQTVAAVERVRDTISAAEAISQHHQQLAEEAPDATEPLDRPRRDRLLDSDRCLCALAPRLCPGDPAPPRDAGDGDEAVCPAATA